MLFEIRAEDGFRFAESLFRSAIKYGTLMKRTPKGSEFRELPSYRLRVKVSRIMLLPFPTRASKLSVLGSANCTKVHLRA